MPLKKAKNAPARLDADGVRWSLDARDPVPTRNAIHTGRVRSARAPQCREANTRTRPL